MQNRLIAATQLSTRNVKIAFVYTPINLESTDVQNISTHACCE